MNQTMEKFGYPATLVRELEHWCILLRPAQAYLLLQRVSAEAPPGVHASVDRAPASGFADGDMNTSPDGRPVRLPADQLDGDPVVDEAGVFEKRVVVFVAGQLSARDSHTPGEKIATE